MHEILIKNGLYYVRFLVIHKLTTFKESKFDILITIFLGISSNLPQQKSPTEEFIAVYTHSPNNLPIPAIAYFINTLDRGGQDYFKVGDLFYKICTSLYTNF